MICIVVKKRDVKVNIYCTSIVKNDIRMIDIMTTSKPAVNHSEFCLQSGVRIDVNHTSLCGEA